MLASCLKRLTVEALAAAATTTLPPVTKTAAKGKAKAKALPKATAKAKAEAKAKDSERQRIKYVVSRAPPTIRDFFQQHKKDPEVAPSLLEALACVKKDDFSNVEAIITATESKSVSTSFVCLKSCARTVSPRMASCRIHLVFDPYCQLVWKHMYAIYRPTYAHAYSAHAQCY